MVFDSMGNIINTIPFSLNNGVIEKRNPQLLQYLPLQKTIKYLPKPKIIKYLPLSVSIKYLPKPKIIKYLPKPKIIKYLPKPKIIKYLSPPQNNILTYSNHNKHQTTLSFTCFSKASGR
jgi:hypothetical protein